jgi:MFS transporter, putative metabolite:H+ symporter
MTAAGPAELSPKQKHKTPLSSYQRRLLFFLGVASFFEGYDFMAITQILTQMRGELGVPKEGGPIIIAVVNAGTVIAYLLVRQADRLGRRRVLTATILGYTLCSFLTGLAPNAIFFTVAQFLARIFLVGEWAISTVYAAEEFPADRRGQVITTLQGFGTVGAIACAGLVPLMLKLPYGWRSVYFAGLAPLLLIAYARRGLKETARFEEAAKSGATRSPALTRIFRTPYRKRVLQLALIWGITYVCTQNALTFWKEFVLGERGFTDADAGLSITIAALLAVPLVFGFGKFLDVAGRRVGATVVFLLTAVGVYGSYTLDSWWALTAALIAGTFGVSAVLPVLNAYNAELFPTELRGEAFAWSNNLLGRIGYVASPLFISAVVQETGRFEPAISPTALAPLVALALILWLLPETRGKELEETSAV